MGRVVPLTLAALLAGAAPAFAADGSVTASNFQFSPPAVTVNAGDKVTWTNPSAGFHNVHFEDGQFDTPATPSSNWPADVSRTFASTGTYKYYCEQHGGPNGTGMSGTVTVVAPPADYVWNGADGDLWTDSAKWTPNGIPGTNPADTATIADGDRPVLNMDLTIARLALSNASGRAGTGTLTVAGTGLANPMTWTGATFLTGKTILAATARAVWTGGQIGSAEVENLGSLSVGGVQFGDGLAGADTARLDNQAALDLTGDLTDASAGGGVLQSSGTITAGATRQVFPALANAGTVTAQAGTLSLQGGSAPPNSGDWAAAAGATLRFAAGTYELENGAHVTGAGTVSIGGTLTIPNLADTGYDVAGVTTIPGGTLSLGPSATTGTLVIDAGLRSGAGTLTVTGGFDAPTLAAFAGSGTTIVMPAETYSAGTIQLRDAGTTLRFAGDLTRSHGLFDVGLGSVMEVGGALSLATLVTDGPNDAIWRLLPGGTLTVSAGVTTRIRGTFESRGTILIAGTLDTTVKVLDGVLAGSGTIAGPLFVEGGTVAPGAPVGTLTMGGALVMSGGTLAVDLASPTSFDKIVAQSGTIGGTLAINAGFTPAPADEFRIIQMFKPTGAFDLTGAEVGDRVFKARKDDSGVVLFNEAKPVATPTPTATAEPTPAPAPTATPTPSPTPARVTFAQVAVLSKKCVARRRMSFRLKAPAASARVLVNGKRFKTVRRPGTVVLKGLPKGRFTLKVEVKLKDGRVVKGSRKYRACTTRRAS